MRIGIPKETKTAEKRVALTPEACGALVQAGHEVFLEKTAGEGAGFADELYEKEGVQIAENAADLYEKGELVVKVKEPLSGDLKNLKDRHSLFCYLHLAAEPDLVEGLKDIGLKAIAFETVVVDGKTPLLAPMSAIAGRLATQIGTWHLHAPRGGRGTLLGGFTGFPKGNVTVVGGGIAGTEAATLACSMGANVTILDINEARLEALKKEIPGVNTVLSTPENLEKLLPETDLLVGAVYVIGRRAPTVITEEHIKMLPKGAVVVDISIDQGGCVATAKPCTHHEPVYEVGGVIHSAITNLPAAAPRTASEALSEAILPYVLKLASGEQDEALAKAVNVENGELKIEL